MFITCTAIYTYPAHSVHTEPTNDTRKIYRCLWLQSSSNKKKCFANKSIFHVCNEPNKLFSFSSRFCYSPLLFEIKDENQWKAKAFRPFQVWLRKVQKSSADNAQRQLCMIGNVHFSIQQKRRNEKSVTIMNMKMIKMMCAEINPNADWHHTCAVSVPIEHFTNRFRLHSLRQTLHTEATEQSRAYAKR